MDKLKAIFSSYVKLGPFCKDFTNLDPKKGLYHRMKGYNTSGTKEATLTDEDTKELKSGLEKLKTEIDEAIKQL